MKKIILPLLFLTSTLCYSQNYHSQLTRLNNYLKAFDKEGDDNLDIDDGYLIYTYGMEEFKIDIRDVGSIKIGDNPKSVDIFCKNGEDCVYSDFDAEYFDRMSFSKEGDFNTKALADMLQNLLDKYNGITTENKSTVTKSTSSNSATVNDLLQQVNSFLKTFDDGYYGSIEIKDGYFIDNFKSGKYSKAKMSDLNYALVDQTNRKVVIKCYGSKECVYSTYTDGYHDEVTFSQTKDFNSKQFSDLLNELLDSYNGDKPSNKNTSKATNTIVKKTTKSTIPLNDALKQLNDYLKTFDNGYYGYFEIKDGYIYDRFKAGKYDKFEMEDMEGAVIQEEYKRVIFKCKGNNKCISTDWKEYGQEEYIQFLTGRSAFDYGKLADLLNNFMQSYLGE